ncbi:hypothetical protein O3M35_001783 [Rhynocoris fuscipes]|uniref:ATP synthase mitochondrial F1 complex assembly factor 1 n=1 Tax=Rhynocoris fuscipes TaxID=488301 RepID=A0AAW1CWD5_9HEMI
MALRLFKIFKNNYKTFISTRTIMSTNINLKEVEKELENNPYWGKYQEKIEKLRKEQPEQYLSRLKAKEEAIKAKEEKKKERKYPEPRDNVKTDSVNKKGLSDILKLELIENKTAEEIKDIWNNYHKGKDVIYSTFTNEIFNKLNNNFINYPIFVLPLPRGDGYEFFLLQYSDNVLHFTPLVLYKKHGENSPECFSVSYYTELKDKDIILMKGDFDKDVLSSLESQCLLNTVHMFYNGESDVRTNMIKMFNKKPDEFKFPEIISEVERLGFIDITPK